MDKIFDWKSCLITVAYMEQVYKNRPELRDQILYPLQPIKNGYSKNLFQDEFGVVKATIRHLKNGETPTIMAAIDKTAYFSAKVEKKYPRKTEKYKIISEYTTSSNLLTIEDKFGILKISPREYLNQETHHISSALNPSEYCANQLSYIRGDFYDYSKVIFKKQHTKIIIGCPLHGDFLQTPSSHSRGHGCLHCFSDSNKIKVAERIEDVSLLHNFKYTYIYKDTDFLQDYIEVICPIHGSFLQKFVSHAEGKGCTSCASVVRRLSIYKEVSKDASSIPASLYIMKFSLGEEIFFKVGISTMVEKRLKSYDYSGYTVSTLYTQEGSLLDVSVWEANILREFKEVKHFPKRYFGGHTECLQVNPINYRMEWYEDRHEQDVKMCEEYGEEYNYICK